MSDPRTRAALRALEEARVDALRLRLQRARERRDALQESLRSLHAAHDADVRARSEARAAVEGSRDGAALARWARDDDARRAALRAACSRRLAEEAALRRASREVDELAREIAERLARALALREPEQPTGDDDD
ncbi:MAG: hypothetical protein R3A48_17180 [Polyangiales bacterium]